MVCDIRLSKLLTMEYMMGPTFDPTAEPAWPTWGRR